ncbi:MAG: acetolactate synthase catalytic subunit [Rhizobiales bacterium]|nr:acetolactate synthase catalytic subunit [Hyphomicrobiales bacterium]
MSNEPTVAEMIAGSLARHGVEILFAQSLPSMVALSAEDLNIRQFAYRTETAGAAMADGFARLSGRVGVVMAQNGPAATLLVPGLAEALKSSIPIVALVQDVNRPQADRNAFQELDHIGLFQPVSKWVRRVTEPDRAIDYLDMAFAVAASGRPGPAVLLLPADVLLERVKPPSARHAALGTYPLDRSIADPQRIAEAADLLAKARHPLVVAGGGVHLSGAAAEVAALQANAHLPVMTTVMGKGAVDETHPLSLGVAGYNLGHMAPARDLRPLIEQADVVLLIGTRTNQNGTDSWALYPDGAKYIHIDVDPAEVGRNYEALRLVGDAKLTLAALLEQLRGRRSPDAGVARAIADARAKHAEEIAPLMQSNASPVHPVRMMADLQQVLTPDAIVVADASYSTLWVACYLKALRSGMRFITPRGLAGLGWGLPLAIGAKMAQPQSPVICLVGDGGFAHVWSELETAHRMQAKIVLTVLNNGVLAYQKDAEDVKFNRHTSACYFTPVDHAQIARVCGCRGVRVERPSEYLPALREALAANETTVIDVITDPQAYPPITFFDETLERVRAERNK